MQYTQSNVISKKKLLHLRPINKSKNYLKMIDISNNVNYRDSIKGDGKNINKRIEKLNRRINKILNTDANRIVNSKINNNPIYSENINLSKGIIKYVNNSNIHNNVIKLNKDNLCYSNKGSNSMEINNKVNKSTENINKNWKLARNTININNYLNFNQGNSLSGYINVTNINPNNKILTFGVSIPESRRESNQDSLSNSNKNFGPINYKKHTTNNKTSKNGIPFSNGSYKNNILLYQNSAKYGTKKYKNKTKKVLITKVKNHLRGKSGIPKNKNFSLNNQIDYFTNDNFYSSKEKLNSFYSSRTNKSVNISKSKNKITTSNYNSNEKKTKHSNKINKILTIMNSYMNPLKFSNNNLTYNSNLHKKNKFARIHKRNTNLQNMSLKSVYSSSFKKKNNSKDSYQKKQSLKLYQNNSNNNYYNCATNENILFSNRNENSSICSTFTNSAINNSNHLNKNVIIKCKKAIQRNIKNSKTVKLLYLKTLNSININNINNVNKHQENQIKKVMKTQVLTTHSKSSKNKKFINNVYYSGGGEVKESISLNTKKISSNSSDKKFKSTNNRKSAKERIDVMFSQKMKEILTDKKKNFISVINSGKRSQKQKKKELNNYKKDRSVQTRAGYYNARIDIINNVLKGRTLTQKTNHLVSHKRRKFTQKINYSSQNPSLLYKQHIYSNLRSEMDKK